MLVPSGGLAAGIIILMTITAILLPGLDGTGELLAPFVAAAPREITTVVVGYPTSEASIDVLERRVRERLTNSCVVIAESFSGPIGVRVAADVRVRALILCNSFVTSPISPAFLNSISGIHAPSFSSR
jgi:hypothetical protein